MSPAPHSRPSESDPLLGDGRPKPVKKPFYRPRPLWIAPFALLSALVRGMTLAPRVQVYTQLACDAVWDRYNHTTSHESLSLLDYALYNYNPLYIALDPAGPQLHPETSTHTIIFLPHHANASTPTHPRTHAAPPKKHSNPCLADPRVQSAAARIQTIMMTTMGIMSAITTGWWGHFGERYGRTKVLAAGCVGMLTTDVILTLISTPGSPFSHPRLGQALLVLAPFIEGLLGGWSTLQATTSAYIADCTSDGSRAHIFSRFIGIMFLGVSIGPALGGLLIRNPIPFLTPALPGAPAKAVTSVFVIAIMVSLVNILSLAFVIPESLDKNRKPAVASTPEIAADREATLSADIEDAEVGGTDVGGAEVVFSPSRSLSRPILESATPSTRPSKPDAPSQGHLARIAASFAIFMPRAQFSATGKRHMDYSMTLLGTALLGYLLSTGIFQIKYLYAEHIFDWGAAEIADYITIAAGLRMVHTLLIMPYVISRFKPKAPASPPGAPQAAPSLQHLEKEMSFDLWLVRISLVIDIASHTAVAIAPANDSAHAAALFTFFSVVSGFGAGVVPALQSLALCVVHRNNARDGKEAQGGAGRVFGGLASLQSVGQQILGPILFGVLYSNTVGVFPKAIFVGAAGILVVALVFVCLLRPDAGVKQLAKKKKRVRSVAEAERGRSRATKDLRPVSPASMLSPPSAPSSLTEPRVMSSDEFVQGSSGSN